MLNYLYNLFFSKPDDEDDYYDIYGLDDDDDYDYDDFNPYSNQTVNVTTTTFVKPYLSNLRHAMRKG